MQQLRAEHADARAYVDALIDEYGLLQGAEARGAMPIADEILKVSREIDYDRGEAYGLLTVGFGHFLMQRNQDAFVFILDAMARFDGMDEPIAQARCRTVLTSLYTSMGSYQKALEHGHDALSRLGDEKIVEWHGWPHYMLGDAYRAAGDLGRAREHYGNAYVIFTDRSIPSGIVRALIGLGGVCREQGDYDASEKHFTEARNLADQRKDPTTMARLLSDLALLRQLTGDSDEAFSLLEESLQMRRELGGGLLAATCLIDLGNLMLATGRPDEAIDWLSEALEISVHNDHKPRMYSTHEALSRAYALKGDLEKALIHHQQYHRIKEDVMGTDTTTRLQNLEFSLEAAAAQKEADMIKAHNEELQSKNDELSRLLKELGDTQEMLIQSEKMASLGQLTAGIAHEIKNPLNFVNNFSVMTKDLAVELSDEIVEHREEAVKAIEQQILDLASEITANADRILEHGRRAGQIVNGMLVHSRQSGGKKTEVDVNELVLNCVDLAYHGFTATNDAFEAVIDTELSSGAGSFNVIEDEVARVLTNILNNAFFALGEWDGKERDGFTPHVRVTSSRSDGKVTITIMDNGPGVPDEHKKKIFDPFFTTKPTGSGTGLGLSQSYEIIAKRHGGTLSVTDSEGGGATFVVALPA